MSRDPDEDETVETPTLTDAQLLDLIPRHPWEDAAAKRLTEDARRVVAALENNDRNEGDSDA